MKKRLVKLVSVLLMLSVVSGLCACDEFDDYDDYDNGNVYEDDYDDDYDDSYDDESDEPAKVADGTVVVSDFKFIHCFTKDFPKAARRLTAKRQMPTKSSLQKL